MDDGHVCRSDLQRSQKARRKVLSMLRSPWVLGVGRWALSVCATLILSLVVSVGVRAQGGGGRGAAPPAPTTPRTTAPFDPTGYWVAIISEDWRWRMITPAKGDFPSIPMSREGQRVAEAWDPAKDIAAGEQCRAYGAPGLMRGPTRLHITWQDDNTLKLESDYGTQTRLFRFGSQQPAQGARTWQGLSTPEWIIAGGSGRRREGPGRLREMALPPTRARRTSPETCPVS